MPERTNHRAIIALLLGLWLSVGLLQAEAGDRAIGVAPGGQPGNVSITGEYWAVLIGIDEYAHAPDLESAVRDVRAVRAVLETRYGFHPSRIKQLLNAQATRKNIENTLYALSREAGPEDSVFIYYAGHGQYDQARDHGWWVPTDGEPRQAGTLITNANILRYVKGMQARHVYLVADSCFSGSLFGTRALPPITDRWYAELYKDRSRWGLTSGATEPVADRGLGGHSPFAYFLLKLLRENEQPYLVPSTIHESLAPLVANNTNQVPRSEPLTQTGDEGGQFVFRLTKEHLHGDSREEPRQNAPEQLAVAQLTMEREFWNSIKDSQASGGFKAYLNQYPDGLYAELARQRLEAGLELTQETRQWIQRGLAAVGFDPGAFSGRFDSGTRVAIRQWQAAQKGQVTGYLDEDSAATLQTAGQQQEAERRQAAAQQRAATLKELLPSLLENLKQQMVTVQGGTFTMGCTEEQSSCDDDERPIHRVRVRSFEISQHEVTQELWEAVMGENPSKLRNCPLCPVEQVSWEDIQAFLKKLNALMGEQYRLPTEAEWEYAARGGQQSQGYQYAGSDKPQSVAWGSYVWFHSKKYKIHPVGQKAPNELALYDMSGNVWEWVEDCWNRSYRDAPSDGSAWTSGDCSARVLRGGSSYNAPRNLRSATRFGNAPGFRSKAYGFRLARTLF